MDEWAEVADGGMDGGPDGRGDPAERAGRLQKTFNVYDESGRGVIPSNSVGVVLWTSGYAVPVSEELQVQMKRVDPSFDPEGHVSWDLVQRLAAQLENAGDVQPTPVAMNSSTNLSPGRQRKTPPRKLDLSSRTYLEHGELVENKEVLEFMKALDEHRKKCEKENNYLEARSTAKRLHDLKVYEEAKRRNGMSQRQAQERTDAEAAYQQECEENNQMWDEKMGQYQASVMEQVSRLKEQHSEQLHIFREDMNARQPQKPQWSKELLNQRKIQVSLGKQMKYLEAEQVKRMADRMEQAEMQATLAMFEAEVELKEGALRTKQQLEMEALMQRATRGRDELRKARALDADRRQQRYKNVVRELEALHRLEQTRLDSFVEKRTLAGKRDSALAQQAQKEALRRKTPSDLMGPLDSPREQDSKNNLTADSSET